MSNCHFIINRSWNGTVKCGFSDSEVYGIDHPTNWYGDSEVIDWNESEFIGEMMANGVTLVTDEKRDTFVTVNTLLDRLSPIDKAKAHGWVTAFNPAR